MDCKRIQVLVPAAVETPRGAEWAASAVVWILHRALRGAMCFASSMPFDAMRAYHAGLVKAGWIEPSIIACGHLERRLDVLEKLALGPLARRV